MTRAKVSLVTLRGSPCLSPSSRLGGTDKSARLARGVSTDDDVVLVSFGNYTDKPSGACPCHPIVFLYT